MIQFAQIIFILSVLVILHEFGHYITAKIFKVRVEKFYLFMDAGFSLFKKKIGETEWGIGWLPIGGYVKMSGMIDESMDKEQMKEEPKEWEFRAKPAWQRLIIMLGGIVVNFILAWAIYAIMFSTVGQKYISAESVQKNGLSFGEVGESVGFKNGDKIISIDGKTIQPKFKWFVIDILLSESIEIDRNGEIVTINITEEQKADILGREGKGFVGTRKARVFIDSLKPNSNALASGLMKGDEFVSVNNIKTIYFDQLSAVLKKNSNDSISIEVLRNNQKIVLDAKVNSDGQLGFYPGFNSNESHLVNNKLSFMDASSAAVKESYQLFIYNIKQFKLILSPKTEAYKQVKSPIGIARQLPESWNWEFVWNFTALFSIALAFFNLLPIPGLDGGHALFTIVEMVSGRTPSDKTMEYIQSGGMIFLLSLMALVFGKDIFQWVMVYI